VPSPAGPAADEVAWSFLKDSGTAEQLQRFIAEYPASPRRGEAEERLKALEPNVAVIVPVGPAEVAKPTGNPCGGVTTVSLGSRKAAPLSMAEECSLKPKDSFRECEDCPEMVVVPAGSFTMGSPENEKDRDNDEGPQHVVTIGRPFAVGKWHMTRDQFAVFARETSFADHSKCSWSNPGAGDGSHPVTCISWDDTKAYIEWVAKKTGKPYRMLTEAEFEYAARGRTSPGAYPRFWFGDNERNLCRYGNFADKKSMFSGAPCDDGYKYTSPTGHYQPNAFGLYDMFGNALQWTQDCWHDHYYGAPSDGSAWTTNCREDRPLVARGGHWLSQPERLRAAARAMVFRSENGVIGFRLARTLTP
jgi:formylglycine-generating enzyme required for sulfatase activity